MAFVGLGTMRGMSIERNNLLSVFNGLLQPERFKDYGPNGLQVEGKSEIRRIVSGVTASRALIEAAIDAKADAIFVHHGLFWRGMDGRITGWLKERIRLLLAHDINLFAYHLPLDAHAELGNNAQLGARLGVQGQAAFGDQNLGWLADVDFADAAAEQGFLHVGWYGHGHAAHVQNGLNLLRLQRATHVENWQHIEDKHFSE